MKHFAPVISLVLLGCIHEPEHRAGAIPGVPVPSPAQVSSCESTRSWHNFWVMSGAFFGAAVGAEGSADAVTTNKTAQAGIGIGTATSGVLAAVSAAAAGIEADTYASSNCQAILSQAPVSP